MKGKIVGFNVGENEITIKIISGDVDRIPIGKEVKIEFEEVKE